MYMLGSQVSETPKRLDFQKEVQGIEESAEPGRKRNALARALRDGRFMTGL